MFKFSEQFNLLYNIDLFLLYQQGIVSKYSIRFWPNLTKNIRSKLNESLCLTQINSVNWTIGSKFKKKLTEFNVQSDTIRNEFLVSVSKFDPDFRTEFDWICYLLFFRPNSINLWFFEFEMFILYIHIIYIHIIMWGLNVFVTILPSLNLIFLKFAFLLSF